jgi:NAD(P)H-hydrate epimerase
MASGGQGDVLAGVAGALLAQGLDTADAGALAAWLCGRAAERVEGPIATAGATSAMLGGALDDWRGRRR